MDEQTWRSDFEIFAADLKWAPLRANSRAAPLTPGPHIRLKLGAAIDACLPPPQQDLLRIDERLEHSLGRYGDLDLTNDFILIGRNSNCTCVRQRDTPALFFDKLFQLLHDSRPTTGIIRAGDRQRSEATVRNSDVRTIVYRGEFPAHQGATVGSVVPVSDPRVGEQSRRIALDYFTVAFELADAVDRDRCLLGGVGIVAA